MTRTLKALSIVFPGGTKIRDGLKTLEVRRWQPDSLPLKDLLIVENFRRLSDDLPEDPDGKAVAIVDITEIREWKRDDFEAAAASYWEPGWLCWKIENVRPVSSTAPIPAKLRIYDVDFPDQ